MKDGNAITIGIWTFRSDKDCEAFLVQECPGGLLNMCNYDMESLLHRIQQEGAKVSAMDEVQNNVAARKSGSQTQQVR
jgi:hypothetical protein